MNGVLGPERGPLSHPSPFPHPNATSLWVRVVSGMEEGGVRRRFSNELFFRLPQFHSEVGPGHHGPSGLGRRSGGAGPRGRDLRGRGVRDSLCPVPYRSLPEEGGFSRRRERGVGVCLSWFLSRRRWSGFPCEGGRRDHDSRSLRRRVGEDAGTDTLTATSLPRPTSTPDRGGPDRLS